MPENNRSLEDSTDHMTSLKGTKENLKIPKSTFFPSASKRSRQDSSASEV
jgi:hypothetical protein